MENRRDFIKKVSVGVAAVAVGSRHLNLSARSYTHIPRANDTIRVGVVGFSDRFRSSLLPSFMNHAQDLNFEIVALSIYGTVAVRKEKHISKKKRDGMLLYVAITMNFMTRMTLMRSS